MLVLSVTLPIGDNSSSFSLVTKQIVDQHGGTISVHSTGEGTGTSFTVRLPCTVGDNDREEDLFDLEADTNMKRTFPNIHRSGLRASSFTDQSF
eukprot:gene7869-10648_t